MPNRRPQLKMAVSSAASEAEAAAVIAAVQQFLRDTAPALVAQEPRPDPWLRAALLEQTGREPDGPTEWGDAHPW
ncbi:MAG: hypothetical protein JWN65_1786 [Solirubrobacterales bacterium]|jgi:beta-phosphoglucomutase-like phosphatase (HAD superfamily)|nr:hypothetical protein [Solirubrobacterales bacterium]